MKKSLLIILLACLASGVAKAQTFNITEKASILSEGDLSCIPPDVCFGGKAVFYTSNSHSFTILDDNFQVKTSFTAQDIFTIEPYINGVYQDNAYLTISQTLFNKDDKWEYVRYIRDNDGVVGFSIVSEDGTVLKEALFGTALSGYDCNCDVFLFPDKCYLAFSEDKWSSASAKYVYEIERDGSSSPAVNQCDVNGDGNVTAGDVTALYDYLLNN